MIAIRAVLILIFLPALAAAKETPKVGYCMANHRDFAKTASRYTNHSSQAINWYRVEYHEGRQEA